MVRIVVKIPSTLYSGGKHATYFLTLLTGYLSQMKHSNKFKYNLKVIYYILFIKTSNIYCVSPLPE